MAMAEGAVVLNAHQSSLLVTVQSSPSSPVAVARQGLTRTKPYDIKASEKTPVGVTTSKYLVTFASTHSHGSVVLVGIGSSVAVVTPALAWMNPASEVAGGRAVAIGMLGVNRANATGRAAKASSP